MGLRAGVCVCVYATRSLLYVYEKTIILYVRVRARVHGKCVYERRAPCEESVEKKKKTNEILKVIKCDFI